MADIIFSEREHPLYEKYVDDWELYQSAAEGGKEFINDTNLFSHRLEDAEDFESRLDRAHFLNFCDTIPSMYNSYIFKEGVERPGNSELEQFRTNVDGKGTNISEFIKNAGYWASVYGAVHILVNQPVLTKTPKSRADQKENGQYPYASIIFPTQLKDWSLDRQGNFNWVIIETTYYDDIDPNVEREESQHYMLITKDRWEIQDEDGEPVKFSDGAPNNGPNDLGIIPIYTIYNKRGTDKVGKSLLKDIVYINRSIFNWGSCIDEQIERQTFSQLVVPDDGSMAEKEESGESDILREIGTSSLWTFPFDARHPPAFISPDVANIETIWKQIVDHIKEIFRLSGLQGGTSDLYTSKSGRQSQYSFIGVNSALAEKSASYQEAENQISKLALMHLGSDPTSFQEVKYPSTFDIQALADEIDSIFSIMERNFSVRLNKELQKNVARKALPHATQKVLIEVEQEIESGDGIVNPINKNKINEDETKDDKREKDGDGNPNTNLGDSFKSSKELEDEEIKKEKKED